MAMKFGTKQSGVGYAQRPFKTVETFNLDGLELARVKPKRREFPLRHVFFFVLAIMSFKIFLFLDMGGAAYGAKVAELSAGTTLEKAAAWTMTLDPASQWFVNGIRFGAW